MDRERHRFAAALTRFLVAAAALALLPAFYPALADHVGVFVAYLSVAGVFQILIWKNLGGELRALVGGLADIAMITFLVQRIGSVATMMVAAYFFAAVVNSLVVGRRTGIALAIVGALAYCTTLALEATEVLPYAPAALSYVSGTRPSAGEYLGSGITMGLMQISASLLVGRLVVQNERHAKELAAANAALQELSVRDPLTRLYNRRYLMERLDAELARVRRGGSLAVVMLDLDRFKRVNDERGHHVGDVLLGSLAEAIGDAVRTTDVVGRYGGDEFVVVLPDTREDEAEVACRRVTEAVRAAGLAFDSERPVTASVGLALARSSDEPRALLQRADRAAYAAKAHGGDRVQRESLLPALDQAIEHDAQ